MDHGGKVLDSFPGEKRPLLPQSELIVLSDGARETMSFLSAITYGYQRIHYQWIQDSIQLEKLMPRKNYLLPLGYSSILKREVEQSEKSKSLTHLLEGKNVLVTSEDQVIRKINIESNFPISKNL